MTFIFTWISMYLIEIIIFLWVCQFSGWNSYKCKSCLTRLQYIFTLKNYNAYSGRYFTIVSLSQNLVLFFYTNQNQSVKMQLIIFHFQSYNVPVNFCVNFSQSCKGQSKYIGILQRTFLCANKSCWLAAEISLQFPLTSTNHF